MPFKVGDIVMVRSDLVLDRSYDHLNFHHDMARFRGKKYKIEKIDNYGRYILEGLMIDTTYSWLFNDRMLLPFDLEQKKAEV